MYNGAVVCIVCVMILVMLWPPLQLRAEQNSTHLNPTFYLCTQKKKKSTSKTCPNSSPYLLPINFYHFLSPYNVFFIKSLNFSAFYLTNLYVYNSVYNEFFYLCFMTIFFYFSVWRILCEMYTNPMWILT